jgi:hypothetical protein
MRRISELRTVAVGSASGRSIEGVERVRGIKVGTTARGFVMETHTPEAIVVHEADGLRRVALPAPPRSRWLGFAAPAALYLVTRSWLISRRKAR